jgi:hypothetical protein
VVNHGPDPLYISVRDTEQNGVGQPQGIKTPCYADRKRGRRFCRRCGHHSRGQAPDSFKLQTCFDFVKNSDIEADMDIKPLQVFPLRTGLRRLHPSHAAGKS